jgi:hypothetical protein
MTSQETYKGVQVTNYDQGSTAIIGNYAVLGATTTAMHSAIDTFAAGAGASIGNNASYKDLISRLPASHVGTFYAAAAPLINAAMQSQAGVTPQMFSQVQAYRAVVGSLGFVDNGMRIDLAVALDQTKLSECTKQMLLAPNPNQALSAIPADAYFAFSGNNLKGIWDCSLSQMDATSRQQFQDALSQLQSQFGIDLNADILSWMTGEFALAVTPAKPIAPDLPGVGGLLLVQAKDKNTISTKMDKLQVIFSLGGLRFNDQNVNGVPFKVGTSGTGAGSISMGYGFVNNWFVLGAPLDALTDAINASKTPLANQANFKQIQSVLPAKNGGYFYVSVPDIAQLISNNLSGEELTAYQRDVQPWIKPIKGIGLATEVGKTDITMGTIFVSIQGQ